MRVLSAGQSLAAAVQFIPDGSERGGLEFAAEVKIHSGRQSESAVFDIEVDNETLVVVSSRASVSASTKRPSEPTMFVVSAREPGQSSHTLWVQIFQKNRLIHMVTVNIGEPQPAAP